MANTTDDTRLMVVFNTLLIVSTMLMGCTDRPSTSLYIEAQDIMSMSRDDFLAMYPKVSEQPIFKVDEYDKRDERYSISYTYHLNDFNSNVAIDVTEDVYASNNRIIHFERYYSPRLSEIDIIDYNLSLYNLIKDNYNRLFGLGECTARETLITLLSCEWHLPHDVYVYVSWVAGHTSINENVWVYGFNPYKSE